MSTNDGGPAFPVTPHGESVGGVTGGMTLRDYFAGQAMAGIVGSIDSEENYGRLKDLAASQGMRVSEWIARDAYKQADAMLAAREAP